MARGGTLRLGDNFDPEEVKAALESDEVMDACYDLAQEAAEYWRSISPVRTGKYRDSIKVRRAKRWVTVSASDYKAHWIEYGTVKMAALAPRARTAAHFSGTEGFKITEKDIIPKKRRRIQRRRGRRRR